MQSSKLLVQIKFKYLTNVTMQYGFKVIKREIHHERKSALMMAPSLTLMIGVDI